MAKTLEFFFDVVSPTVYLASTQLPSLIERTGATLNPRPFFLGGVMQATGNRPPATVPAKGVWMNGDLNRFAKRYGVPMSPNPHFPMNTLAIQRALSAWVGTPEGDTLFDVAVKACWVEPINVGDRDVLSSTLAEGGVDVKAFWAAAADEKNKDALKETTEEAIQRGAFGAPTFFVGDEMFFGQDRLDFVEEALTA
ncbi:MAG: 2-hydroxychromene-2-carboxylate isomerase [Pseudomonadota bacterium]